MATQILLLCAVTIGVGADAVTKEAGSVIVVDDGLADDLVKREHPAAKLDSSELPAPARSPRRSQAAKPSAAPADAGSADAGGEGQDAASTDTSGAAG